MSTVAERPTPANDVVYIDTAEVARLLHIATGTVRSLEAQGRLPRGIRLSMRRVRWPLHTIQALAHKWRA